MPRPRDYHSKCAGEEHRKVIIHGREYWMTKEEFINEMGMDPEDAEEMWKQLPKK